MHLDGVGSAALPAADRTLIRPIWFSWPLAVSLRKPPLMAVGFSWISLYSLIRIEIFQWVRRLEAGKSFSRTFALALEAPQREARGRGHAEAPDCSWGKLNRISDFLQ